MRTLPVLLAMLAAARADCAALAAAARGGPRPAEARAERVLLLWAGRTERAAAAVLRAVLLAAGHEPARVRTWHSPQAASLCALRRTTPAALAPPEWRAALLVAAAVPGGAACALPAYGLRALREDTARAAPWLQARPPRACPAPLPAAAPDAAALATCGFSPEDSGTVYVPEEWRAATGRLPPGLGARVVGRAELERLASEPGRGLLLLDAEPLAGAELLLPLGAARVVADVEQLLLRAPSLHRLLAADAHPFAPGADLLRAVQRAAAPEEAACELAPAAPEFAHWVAAARARPVRRALALLCAGDPAEAEYRAVVEDVVPEYFYETFRPAAAVEMELEVVDCGDGVAARLAELALRWRGSGESTRTVGAALPAELAAAAELLRPDGVPALLYSTGAGGAAAATCAPERLGAALRALLAACGWERAAVLEDGSAAAGTVRRALLAGGGAAARAASSPEPAAALDELEVWAPRVFVALGSARWTRRALAAARARGHTAAGHAWLLTAWDAAAEETRALRPLEVSCAWRGEAPAGGLGARLRARLGGAPWPQHAAAMADALLTFAMVHDVVSRDLDVPADRLEHFWRTLSKTQIPGVLRNLSYDERGVRDPLVYVRRWGERPALLHAGPSPPHACPLRGPVRDPAPPCALPSADRFERRCHDAAAAGGAAALLGLIVLAAGARALLARRDRHLRRAAAERALSRREAAFAELARYAVDPCRVRLGAELGAGRFGRVRLAELRRGRGPPLALAAKAPRADAGPGEEREFLREARTLAALRHARVVRFVGVCWDGGAPLLLMERAAHGDLLHYLRARRGLAPGAAEAAHVSAAALSRMAREAAEALAYLATRGVVHRDVRAANCLVDARRSVKLADFGLARAVGAADGEYSCRGRALFPVLWMAPESLARGVASAASDVWAFGVLALELVTLGARPWGAAPPARAVRAVLAGARPPLPRGLGAETRALLLACWRRAPRRRPRAAALAAWLGRRPRALRPAQPAPAPDNDCDSGIDAADDPPPLDDFTLC